MEESGHLQQSITEGILDAKDGCVNVSGCREMEVDERMLGELEAMGFSKTLAAKALSSSGNLSIGDAINWFVDHDDDAASTETSTEPEVLQNINIEASDTIQISEQVKLKVQELRNQARKKRAEQEKKLDREREKDKPIDICLAMEESGHHQQSITEGILDAKDGCVNVSGCREIPYELKLNENKTWYSMCFEFPEVPTNPNSESKDLVSCEEVVEKEIEEKPSVRNDFDMLLAQEILEYEYLEKLQKEEDDATDNEEEEAATDNTLVAQDHATKIWGTEIWGKRRINCAATTKPTKKDVEIRIKEWAHCRSLLKAELDRRIK